MGRIRGCFRSVVGEYAGGASGCGKLHELRSSSIRISKLL